MKYHIILERDWMYNDENYYCSDDFSGMPKNVFLNPNEAEDACFELNRKQLNGLTINEYDGLGFDDYENLLSELPHIVIKNNWAIEVKPNLTKEECTKLMRFIGKYPFYFISVLEGQNAN